jgi:Barstar (barnase inhibitor)
VSPLDAVVAGGRTPGVYRFSSAEPAAALAERLVEAGWVAPIIDGYAVADRDASLRACADGLRLPGWFGHNWDGLHDCLIDLSWLDAAGQLVLWEGAATLLDADPASWRTACEVFTSAASVRWALALSPLFLAVRGVDDEALPAL